MPRTKCQLQIRLPLTIPHLIPLWRRPIIPINNIARFITGLDLQCASREPVAEDRAHVVPYIGVVDVVCEDLLAGIGREEAIGN